VTLHLHVVAELASTLDPLSALLAAPGGDVLAPEVVVVPNQGVRVWLAEQLARRLGTSGPGRHDGITTNVRFLYIGGLASRALGGRIEDDPWSVDRLTITFLDLIAADPGDIPKVRLTDGVLSAARGIADLFDHYHLRRAGMIRLWAQGEPVLTPVAGSQHPAPLPAHHQWQYELWHRVRARLALPSPPERVAVTLEALRNGSDSSDLPPRVMLVGMSALSPFHLDIVTALATTRDVHVWLLHPSPGLRERVEAKLAAIPQGSALALSDDPTRDTPTLAPLTTWARAPRAMQVVLAASGLTVDSAPSVPAAATGGPLLARVQRALQRDAFDDTPSALSDDDRSLQVHRCHGDGRQAEVLHDALLHTFREIPDLDPREVLIVAPNIVTMAPHLDAVFRARGGAKHDPLYLPLVIADRSLRTENPVAEVLVALLDLLAGRAAAHEVLTLAALEPVKARLGIEDDTLAAWATWAEQLNVHWGIGAEERVAFGIPAEFTAHTWHHALDRLIYGAVLPEAPPSPELGGVVPSQNLDLNNLEAVATLAQLLDRLIALRAAVATPKPLTAWCDLLREALEALCAVSHSQQPALAATLAILSTIQQNAASSAIPVSLAELRHLIDPALAPTPRHPLLRSGAITATSLVPLRAVPYRVVCLVGFDDSAFTAREPDGDDLNRVLPLVGDSDARSEQRGALLDAILAAQERLIVTCVGQDLRTNVSVPPATPLAELLDIARSQVAAAADAEDPIGSVVVDHPRHTFHPDALTPGKLGTRTAFAHDRVALAGARALLSNTDVERDETHQSIRVGLPPIISADHLREFVRDPLRHYVRRVLEIDPYISDTSCEAVIPLEMTTAERDKFQRELWLVACDVAHDSSRFAPMVTDWLAGAAGAGWLPPGAYGSSPQNQLEKLLHKAAKVCADEQRPTGIGGMRRVEIPIANGRRVFGALSGVHQHPSGRITLVEHLTKGLDREMRKTRTHVLRRAMWLDLVLATAAGDDSVVDAWRVLRQSDTTGTLFTLDAQLTPEAQTREGALRLLNSLVALYDEACAAPRPLFGLTSVKLLEDRGSAELAFLRFKEFLRPYHPEMKIYGSAPAFEVVYPVGGDVERFFRAFFGLIEGSGVFGPNATDAAEEVEAD
jgi:exodeoxyribonuclease V gamma subunit